MSDPRRRSKAQPQSTGFWLFSSSSHSWLRPGTPFAFPEMGRSSDGPDVGLTTQTHGVFPMNGLLARLTPLAAVFLLLFGVRDVSAATLSLETGKFLELQPGGSGSLTLSLSNDAGNVTNFNGWVVGIQFLPTLGSTGSIALTSLTQPAVNPAVTNNPGTPFIDPDLEFFDFDGNPTTVNGSSFFTTVQIASGLLSNTQTLLGSTSYNMGTLEFTATADAGGTWNLFAINPNELDGEKSWWYTNGLNTVSYGNLTMPGEGSPANSLQLGTISVVPEPGGIVLAGSAVVAAGWYSWRSRRRVAVVEA